MFHRYVHCSRRAGSLAATLAVVLLGAIGGCAMWDRDRLSLDRYRDERAVDIDHRLQQTQPNVQNPF